MASTSAVLSGRFPELASALAAPGDGRVVTALFARALCTEHEHTALLLDTLHDFVDRGVGRGSIPHEGCLEALSRVLREQGSLRGKACRAVCALLRHDANASAAISTGSDLPELLLAQLTERSADGSLLAEIVVPACRAIANLSLSSAGQARLTEARAVPALLSIARSSHGRYEHAECSAAAFGALLNLADREAGCAQAVSLGVAAVAHDALEVDLADAAVAEAVCGLLWNVTASEVGREAVLAAGCVPLIVAALRATSCCSAPDVAEAVCGALCNLAGSGAIARTACEDAAALDALAVALGEATAAILEPVAGGSCSETSRADHPPGVPPALLALMLETLALLADRGRGNGASSLTEFMPTLARILCSQAAASEEVALGACRVAWFLARHDDNKRAAIGTGLFGALLDASVAVRTPLPIIQAACSAITNFTILPAAREAVVAEAASRPGAASALLGALSACSAAGNAAAGSAICQAVLSLVPDPDVNGREWGSKAAEVLPPEAFPLMAAVFLDFLRAPALEVLAVRDSVVSLRVLLMQHPSVCRSIIALGGIDVLLAVLRHHLTEATIAEGVTFLLWSIAAEEGSGADLARPPSRAAAFVNASIAVLATHAADLDVCEAVCGGLLCVAPYLAGSQALMLRAAEALCGVLRRPACAAHANIVSMACGFINNAHVEPEDEAAILAFGAAPLLEAALHAHGTSDEAAMRITGAISNLCGSAANADAFAALGAPFYRVFVDILRAHERSETAVLQVCGGAGGGRCRSKAASPRCLPRRAGSRRPVKPGDLGRQRSWARRCRGAPRAARRTGAARGQRRGCRSRPPRAAQPLEHAGDGGSGRCRGCPPSARLAARAPRRGGGERERGALPQREGPAGQPGGERERVERSGITAMPTRAPALMTCGCGVQNRPSILIE